MLLNLTRPEIAYFVGFVLGDGTLTSYVRNRGRLSIELSIRDRDILVKFQELFPNINSTLSSRTRNTNFKNNYESSVLSFHDLDFREALIDAGVTSGKKSDIIKPPNKAFSEYDFYRGLIDADGAVGYTGKGIPFVSLNTSSDDMLVAYQSLLLKLIGQKRHNNRNKRDNTYNVLVTTENAQTICKHLYPDGCLSLDRKMKAAQAVMSWRRPATMAKLPEVKRWTSNEDIIVRSKTIEEAATALGRTVSSVANRRFRLRYM